MEFDKVALVTGSGSGLGRAIATAFARSGVKVLVHDVRPDARAVADELGGVFLQADLADQAAVRRLAEQALAEAGRVDILVNNAGFQHIAAVDEFPEEIWTRMLQVMLTAPFQLTKYLLPGMKERGWGRIINISSSHGLIASPFKSAYISAKHGLIGLTKTVALEAGQYGVTANAICPAYVRTPLVENQIADQARTRGIPESEVVERVMLEPAAIKRLIEPEEVAGLVLFLASDGAGAITGGAHTIDLGWTAR
jgi:3-hydroxybutyrate dehydrogenase